MATFDEEGARREGYSDAEIAAFKAKLASPQIAAGAGNIAAPGSAYDPSVSPEPDRSGIAGFFRAPQWVDRTREGVGRAMVHGVNSVGNWIGAVPDSTLATEKQIDAPLMATTAGKVGNAIGEAAITAPLTGGLGEGVSALGSVGARVAANPFAMGAAGGALQGAATADPNERLVNALIGGAGGTVLPAVGAGASKLIRGLARTPEAQRLLDAGIDLTPGQMNPTGGMNQLEHAVHSVWGLNDQVEGARTQAEHQFQAHVVQQGAAPGTRITPSENIHDMLQQAYDSYEPLYDAAKGFPVSPKIMNAKGPDVPLAAAFTQASKAPGVPDSLKASENEWLQDRLTQLPKNAQSDDLLKLRSDIRARARNATLKQDTDSGHVANINERAQDHVTKALESQLPPDALATLRSADSNYGNYKIIENAVAKSKDNIAALTPQKLSEAIYKATPDPAYARGAGGPLRDLARAGTSVFQQRVPNNGARAALLMGSAPLFYTHPVVTGTAAGAAIGSTILPPVRHIAQGVTAPQRLAQALADRTSAAVPQYVKGAGIPILRGLSTAAASREVPDALQMALLARREKEK